MIVNNIISFCEQKAETGVGEPISRHGTRFRGDIVIISYPDADIDRQEQALFDGYSHDGRNRAPSLVPTLLRSRSGLTNGRDMKYISH